MLSYELQSVDEECHADDTDETDELANDSFPFVTANGMAVACQ